MRAIDRKAIEGMGIPGVVLMENAGLQVARAAAEMLLDLTQEGWLAVSEGPLIMPKEGLGGKKVAIVAGKGNNGGDGFVVARHLHQRGAAVKIFVAGEPESLQGDARINLEIIQRIGLPILPVLDATSLEGMERWAREADLIVDALLGTGIHGPVRDPIASAIEAIDRCATPVLAVDVPSGLDSDSGQICGVCVRATRTITLALPKVGLVTYPGASYAGQVTVADIGIPKSLLQDEPVGLELITSDWVRARLPRRRGDSHKGTFGQVLIVAGSVGMTGAAAMAGESAYRAGAGLVRLALPQSLNDAMEARLTEVITIPAAETPARSLSAQALPDLERWLAASDAVCLGCGISTHPDTVALVRELIRKTRLPMLIDADGLNALTGATDLMRERGGPLVITPHPGEMARLLGTTAREVQSHRLEIARSVAVGWNAVVVLKGAFTVVAAPDGRTMVNPTGNPGMATAGSGDILAGTITGLLAQGVPAFEAAAAGVYLHGLAGDLAAKTLGQAGMMATDIGRYLPEAIRHAGGEDR